MGKDFPKLTKEEVKNSPSLRDGVPKETEDQYRKETVKWISKTGESLGMPQFSIATASVYFHRFYSRYSFKEYDRLLLACTCLFLAGKAQETRKKLDDVIDHFNYVIYQKVRRQGKRPGKTSKVFKDFRALVVKTEAILMEAIEFQFNVKHPYGVLVNYIKILFTKEDNEKFKDILMGKQGLAQVAWFFVNDSLRSPLCLMYGPEEVATAVIYMAMKHKKIEYDKIKNRTTPWYTEGNFKMKKAELEAIGEIILDAYGGPKAKKPKEKAPERGKHGSSQIKLTRQESERLKTMSNEQKAKFLKRKKFEGSLTREDRAKYYKMNNEEKLQFKKMVYEKRKRKASHAISSQRHDKKVSQSATSNSQASLPDQKSAGASDKTAKNGLDDGNTAGSQKNDEKKSEVDLDNKHGSSQKETQISKARQPEATHHSDPVSQNFGNGLAVEKADKNGTPSSMPALSPGD